MRWYSIIRSFMKIAKTFALSSPILRIIEKNWFFSEEPKYWASEVVYRLTSSLASSQKSQKGGEGNGRRRRFLQRFRSKLFESQQPTFSLDSGRLYGSTPQQRPASFRNHRWSSFYIYLEELNKSSLHSKNPQGINTCKGRLCSENSK